VGCLDVQCFHHCLGTPAVAVAHEHLQAALRHAAWREMHIPKGCTVPAYTVGMRKRTASFTTNTVLLELCASCECCCATRTLIATSIVFTLYRSTRNGWGCCSNVTSYSWWPLLLPQGLAGCYSSCRSNMRTRGPQTPPCLCKTIPTSFTHCCCMLSHQEPCMCTLWWRVWGGGADRCHAGHLVVKAPTSHRSRREKEVD
jgi:hypothetical protein